MARPWEGSWVCRGPPIGGLVLGCTGVCEMRASATCSGGVSGKGAEDGRSIGVFWRRKVFATGFVGDGSSEVGFRGYSKREDVGKVVQKVS